MTLPMVTCPLCCRPGFNTSDSLCSALVNVTTRKLCCPICNYVVIGLDKFTIHLFSHSVNKYNIEGNRDFIQSCNIGDSSSCLNSIPSSNTYGQFEPPVNSDTNVVKLQTSFDEDMNFKTPNKQELRLTTTNSPNEVQKSLNIPETPLICFRAENGQLFAISPDSLGPSLKNVTINTQNYITNTNITTSAVQTNVVEKIQKRKYSQVFEKDNVDLSNKDQGSPDNYSNIESVNSWPSTPSVSSETDKQTSNSISEREFESCKDLLTKGDFSTLNDDVGEVLKKEADHAENSGNEDLDDFEDKKDYEKKKEGLGCELCPYVFPNKTILAMHKQLIHKKVEVETESKRKLLVCNLCPRTFSLRSSLMIHRRVAHAGGFGNNENGSKQSPSKPACHVCGKFFKKEIHLAQHMKAHDEKQWQCSICSKTFTTKYFLKKHRRLHTGETPYKCNRCGKSFTFQQSYHKHLQYHNDEKPYCCAQCGRLFKELSTLHNHERIHSGEKPFTCETCGKAFRQRVSYLVHRRIHTGAMPYQCTACNKSFRYKISQRTHKCTANPPGVVVRTSGSLVERLQAAMVKAAEENEKKHFADDNSANENIPSKSEVSSSSAEQQSSDKLPAEHSSFPLDSHEKINNSSIVAGNSNILSCPKNSEIDKPTVDKPQIYLLVKGPNEETYYQPLLLSQSGSNTISRVNDLSSNLKNKNKTVKSKHRDKNLYVQKNVDVDINVQQLFSNLVTTDTNIQNKNNPSTLQSFSTGKNIKAPAEVDIKVADEHHQKNSSPDWLIENYKTKSNEVSEKSKITNNVTVDESAVNDIITTLTSEFSETNSGLNNEKGSEGKPESNTDVIMMDSTDIFSLILSPALSSPSERLGKLSLSPGCSSQQNIAIDNFNSPSLFNENCIGSNEIQQDALFDNFSDEALKELLFGTPKQ